MSLADQSRDLMSAGAAWRQESQGVTPEGDNQTGVMEDDFKVTGPAKSFLCYFSSGNAAESLQAMMLFKETYEVALRVNKAQPNFNPADGKIVRLLNANQDASDLLLRIAEIKTSAVNPEWVCGCKAKW